MAVAFLNVNRLTTHIDEIREFVVVKGIHILAINETKLSSDTPDSIIAINDFELERLDRNQHRGVVFYIKDIINYKVVDNLPEHSLELICLEIIPKMAQSFFVLCWYRPPASTVDKFDELGNVLGYLETFNREIILLGDTNRDLLSVESGTGSTAEHIRNIYLDFGMKQLISEPTRETILTSILIDHIATTHPNNIVTSGVIKCGISDHYVVYCVRKFMGNLSRSPKIFVRRQLKNFNTAKFLEDLERIYWDDLVDHDDPTIAAKFWTRVFVGLLDKHAPFRQRKGRNNYAPWITPEVTGKRRTRDILKQKAVKMKSEIVMQAYKEMRNQVNSDNRSQKREYFNNEITQQEGNVKGTWSVINKLINRRSKTTEIPFLNVENKICSEPIEKVAALNDFFIETGENLNKKFQGQNPYLQDSDKIPNTVTKFRFEFITEKAVTKAIMRLKSTKSAGLDQIPNNLLKIAAPIISRSLEKFLTFQ